MQRRTLLMSPLAGSTLLAVAALGGLAGCSAMTSLTSDVSSFGQWPQGRAKGRFVIERLPSQAARADTLQPVEAGLTLALQAAGFTPAADLASADIVVQFGARVTRFDVSPWDDPFWWRWGVGYWRGPAWPGRRVYYPGVWRSPPLPEREVALLLRDRATSVPLWEARATSSGNNVDTRTFQAMYAAALSDFPGAKGEPHAVTVQLPPGP